LPFDIIDGGDRSLAGAGDDRPDCIFRVEAFNLFNHTQFFNPGAAGSVSHIGSPDFGRVLLVRDPRLIQLDLQYYF
jgi:hypothetical protein